MTNVSDDLIKRHEAIAIIHEEMKRSYLPARKNALKQAIDLMKKVPSVEVNTVKSSHWFNASGWWLCYNCGGRNEGWKTTPFCPHCGCPMDELLDAEIE